MQTIRKDLEPSLPEISRPLEYKPSRLIMIRSSPGDRNSWKLDSDLHALHGTRYTFDTDSDKFAYGMSPHFKYFLDALVLFPKYPDGTRFTKEDLRRPSLNGKCPLFAVCPEKYYYTDGHFNRHYGIHLPDNRVLPGMPFVRNAYKEDRSIKYYAPCKSLWKEIWIGGGYETL